MFSRVTYFGSGGFLDFKPGELMKPPSPANDDVASIKLHRTTNRTKLAASPARAVACTRSK
jgi:hypothetical protein